MTTIRQLAVVETLSILGLTPYLHRHDDEKYKTHKLVGIEPTRFNILS